MSLDERKRHVIDCARQLFTERGYRATSTTQIAKAADISEMTLFRYFPRKRDVFLEVIRPVVDVFQLANGLSKDSAQFSTERELWSFISRRLDFIKENRELVLLVLIESQLQPDLMGDVNPIVQVQGQLASVLEKFGLSLENANIVIRQITGILTSALFSPRDPHLDEQVANVVFEDIKRRFHLKGPEA